MPTIYYRTDDPIENLKIRVVVREVSKAKIYNEDGTKIQPFYNEVTLSWQQKLYSPGEISNFLRNKENRGGNAAQVEARRHFAKIEKDGDSVDDMLEEVMMYTYVDKDNYRQETPPPLFDPSTQEPYLGAAVRTLGGVDKGTPRQKALSHRLFRDKPFKAMYICLATDVNEEKLKEPASMWDSEAHFNEHILCCIRLYKDGLLEVTPSFSGVIEEEGLVTHDECSGLSAFIDDHSAETGLKKGFRLATFRVRSAKGSEFEYAIQNINDMLIPYKLEQIEAKKAFVNSIKAAEVRGNASSGSWMQDPPSRDKTVGIYAEIVSGSGFDGEKLFLTYEVTTPQNWLLRTGDLNDGVANVSKPGAISAEQQEQKLLNKKARTEGDEGMLQGVTHTASASHSMRTATTLPFLRPRWKGIHLSFAAGGYSRVAVGLSFFIFSCFSVIVGASYPFWIVPALVIVFVLGTGVPGPPPQVVLLKRKSKSASVNASSKYAQRASQWDYGSQDREIVGDLEPAPVAVFNHLMRFSFDVNDVDPAAHSMLAPSAHMPTLVFQVFSTDWLGRHKLEGYGFHHLSDKPGSCDLEVKTWRPVGKIRDQMVDLFLGNAVYLRDEHFVDSVNKTAAALNRFGVLTQSAGSVRIRVQTIVTDPRTIEDHYREDAEVQQQQDSSLKVKRTVNDILKSFKATMSVGTPGGGRLLSASNSAASMTGIGGIASLGTPSDKSGKGGRPSVLNIMSSLNASARDAKLQDILARARAKTGQGDAGASVATAGNVGIAGIAGIAAGPRAGANAEPVPRPGKAVTAKGAAAMERLKMQLPNSNFNATPGAAASAAPQSRPQATPSTPSHLPVGSTIDTPFANEPYDPYIEKTGGESQATRPGAHKKVPSLGPLGGVGANASTPAPSRASPALAPVTGAGAGRAGAGVGLGSVGEGNSTIASSATSAGGSGPSTGRPAVASPALTARGTPAAAGGSVPNTARKGHRYDPKAASEDDVESSEALLGSGALAIETAEPGTPLAHQQQGADLGASGSDQVGMFGGDEEEQPEDAPLLSTLRK